MWGRVPEGNSALFFHQLSYFHATVSKQPSQVWETAILLMAEPDIVNVIAFQKKFFPLTFPKAGVCKPQDTTINQTGIKKY